MKRILAIFALLFVVLAGIVIAQNYIKSGGVNLFGKTSTATIDNHKFKLIIANTPKEKEVGLSDRKSLASDTAMLFPFGNSDYYAFWMKNMKFPIDIIFIDKNTVVTIYKNVKPPKGSSDNLPLFQPKSPSDSVLEINAGLSEKYGFKEGDAVKIENPK